MKEVFCRLISPLFSSPLFYEYHICHLPSAAQWLVDKQWRENNQKLFHPCSRHATYLPLLYNHARMYSYVRCLVEKESSINTTVGSLLPFEDPTQAPMSQTRISIRDTVSEFCITIYFYKNNSNTITKVRSY